MTNTISFTTNFEKKKNFKKRTNTQSKIQFNHSGPIEKLSALDSTKKSQEALSNNSSLTKIQRINKLAISKNNENENVNVSSWTNFEYNKLFPTCFKCSNFKSKSQTTKSAINLSSLPKNGRNIISIQIETNWGNTCEITIHSIAIFDIYNQQIDPKNNDKGKIYIASSPEPLSLDKLEYLLDASYAKDDTKIFHELFDNKDFTIFLSIHQSIEIGNVRIFNSPIKSQSAVKDVSIYVNEKLYIKDVIPQNFGVNLNLIDQINQKDQLLIPKILGYSDKYGVLPVRPISEIKIEIIETYNCKVIINNDKSKLISSSLSEKNNQNYAGVNGFDFIDLFGEIISTKRNLSQENENDNYVKDINIRGFSDFISCGILLKDKKFTTKEDDMLLGLMNNNQYPTFNFIFNRPTYLSKVHIWNYNGYGENLRCGIKKMKLYADNKLVWFGKVPCGNEKVITNCHSIQLFHSFSDIKKVYF